VGWEDGYAEGRAKALSEAEAERDRLREALDQALDDMGADGLYVCGATKADMRLALGPDADLEYSYEDALKVRIECDELHSKPSPLRAALKGDTP
jgi:hypothetical protein